MYMYMLYILGLYTDCYMYMYLPAVHLGSLADISEQELEDERRIDHE